MPPLVQVPVPRPASRGRDVALVSPGHSLPAPAGLPRHTHGLLRRDSVPGSLDSGLASAVPKMKKHK